MPAGLGRLGAGWPAAEGAWGRHWEGRGHTPEREQGAAARLWLRQAEGWEGGKLATWPQPPPQHTQLVAGDVTGNEKQIFRALLS